MATLLTGATGYLGSYLAADLLRAGEPLNVLVRAASTREAERRLWQSMQLHFPFEEFHAHLRDRIRIFRGDLTADRLGLERDAHEELIGGTDSVLHCAASLNRRSDRLCMNVNVRGTLAMIRLALAVNGTGGLRRFTYVSTVAVAGERSHETVTEDASVAWDRRDYDPYGRTKKLAEHLVRELLPPGRIVIVRPSVVLGDSGRPETTQFDMVRAFSFLASVPVLPFRATDRIDIVPSDWAAACIAGLHRRPETAHDTYHVSSGTRSSTYREITETIAAALDRRAPAFVPVLEKPGAWAAAALSRIGPAKLRRGASLLRVFLPYLTYDTVFDSTRIVTETGRAPAPFPEWGMPLLQWARRHRFSYPYAPWPERTAPPAATPAARPAGSAAS